MEELNLRALEIGMQLVVAMAVVIGGKQNILKTEREQWLWQVLNQELVRYGYGQLTYQETQELRKYLIKTDRFKEIEQ